MISQLLLIFTRSPLHVGAGSSVGAIDLPIQRERHTHFPIIPASTLKGSLADLCNTRDATVGKIQRNDEGKWLFGTGADEKATVPADAQATGDPSTTAPQKASSGSAGSLLLSEARLLAFPIRSAKGCFAWITCPLMLQRAARDGVFSGLALNDIMALPKLTSQNEAIFKLDGPLALENPQQPALPNQIVLEEYCFSAAPSAKYPKELAPALSKLIQDALWSTSIPDRLVILPDGAMQHFANTSCEIAQHVRISDETGTAEPGGLFSQENVPADTLFYSVVHCLPGRSSHSGKSARDTATTFGETLKGAPYFQFGGDATTGLGFCTVEIHPVPPTAAVQPAGG